MRFGFEQQGNLTEGEQERWQLAGSEPECYELYKVPRLFGPLARQFLGGVCLEPGQRVLDVACGTGILARLAALRVAPSGKVAGCDLNAAMLAMARARAAGLAIQWKQADAGALPFEDASFDFVLCQQGLQFFPDRPRALREMRRVLVPAGMLALNVWGQVDRYNAALAKGLTRHLDARTAARSLAPFALSDPAALRALLEGAGFNDVDVRSVSLTRYVVPSQEWLLQDTGASPYASAITALDAVTRAALIRDTATTLKDLWDVDSFAVPVDVHFVYAKK